MIGLLELIRVLFWFNVFFFFFFKQKTAYEITVWLEFRRVLFRSEAIAHWWKGKCYPETLSALFLPVTRRDIVFSGSRVSDCFHHWCVQSLCFRFPPQLLFDNAEYWHLIRIGDMPEGMGFSKSSSSCFITAREFFTVGNQLWVAPAWLQWIQMNSYIKAISIWLQRNLVIEPQNSSLTWGVPDSMHT